MSTLGGDCNRRRVDNSGHDRKVASDEELAGKVVEFQPIACFVQSP